MLLKDILKDYRVVLASASPRRKEMLEFAGLQFTVAPKYAADESYPEELEKREVAAYISANKAMQYPLTLSKNDIVITADTIVLVDDMILGKPSCRDEAERFLNLLSGRSHEVITAFTIRTHDSVITKSVTTTVWFGTLDNEHIHYYIDKYRPFDKAGAYGIQEWIGLVGIVRIDGSYNNVVGLPLFQLYSALKDICLGKKLFI